MSKKLPDIGTWGFITGNHKISDEYWRKRYSQGIFGRVIGYQIKLRTKHILIRAYTRNGRSHLNTTIKFFKYYNK